MIGKGMQRQIIAKRRFRHLNHSWNPLSSRADDSTFEHIGGRRISYAGNITFQSGVDHDPEASAGQNGTSVCDSDDQKDGSRPVVRK